MAKSRGRSTLRIFGPLVVVAVVGGLLPATPAGATWPGTNGAIGFTLHVVDCRGGADCHVDDHIFVTDAAGAKPPLLLAGSRPNDARPDWSPDGNRIAFEGYQDELSSYTGIYTMAADGGDAEELTTSFRNRAPRWSPTGDSIAFVREVTGNDERLFIMDADGLNQGSIETGYSVRLGSGIGWTPEGNITFWGYTDDTDHGLYMTNVKGTEVQLIISVEKIQDATGANATPMTIDWSPSGQFGLFIAGVPQEGTSTCGTSDVQEDIWAVEQNGELHRVTTTDGEFDLWEGDPVWAPSEDRIAFTGFEYLCVDDGGDPFKRQGPSHLYTATADGTDVRLIEDPPTVTDYRYEPRAPSWQPCVEATVLCGRPPGPGGYPFGSTHPVTQAAKRRVPLGATLGATRVPVRFDWTATDDRTPANQLRFDVQLRDTAVPGWTVLLSNGLANTTTSLLVPGRTYQLRHRVRDTAGNVSAFLTSSTFMPSAIQESKPSPALVYTGSWNRVERPDSYGGFVQTSTDAGARATFTFDGRRGVGVAMPMRAGLGVAEVCLQTGSGTPSCTSVDLGTATAPRKLVFARSSLARATTHKVRITVVSGRVDLDAFELLT